MAKKIQISDDNGSTWFTFSGNTGDLRSEAGDIRDTVYGQDYASGQTGLINHTVRANGIYKGFAGYVAKLLKSGASTTFTGEAMTLVSGKTYKITSAAKNVWDHTATFTFNDGSPILAANIESINHLHGRVTFISSFTPAGAVTVDGKYYPMTQIAKAQGFSLKQTAAVINDTDFETAQANGGTRTCQYGLKQVSLDVNGVYATSNAFKTLLVARSEIVVEINPDGASKSVARGYFKPMNTGQSGDVGDLEVETISFALSVPDDPDVDTPFKWIHDATSVLNVGVQKALTSWEGKLVYDFRYLQDGTNGFKGKGILTDISLSGGLEAMNEFTVNVQFSGALTAVP